MKKIISLIIIITMILVTIPIFTGCGANNIDMKEYVNVTYEGLNGYAKADVEIDRDGLDKAIDEAKFDKYISTLFEENNLFGIFNDITDISFSDCFIVELAESYNNLKNGQEIKVCVTIDSYFFGADETLESFQKKLGINIKNMDFTTNVLGLEEPKQLDLFGDDIESYIEYSGADGYIEGIVEIPDDYYREQDGFYFKKGRYINTVKIIKDNEVVCEINYNFANENLSNEETVTIYASSNNQNINSNLEKYKYVAVCEKTITVPYVGKYWNSEDGFSTDITNKIAIAVRDKLAEDNEFEPMVTYICKLRPDVESTDKADMAVISVYYYEGWFSSGYYSWNGYDIILDKSQNVKDYTTVAYTSKVFPIESIEKIKDEINKCYEIISEIK